MKVLGSSSLCCEMKHPVAWVMTAACSGLGAHRPAAPRLLDPVPRRSSGGRTDLWCECRSVSAQPHIPLLSAPAGGWPQEDGPRSLLPVEGGAGKPVPGVFLTVSLLVHRDKVAFSPESGAVQRWRVLQLRTPLVCDVTADGVRLVPAEPGHARCC